jgi:hypothetical protein
MCREAPGNSVDIRAQMTVRLVGVVNNVFVGLIFHEPVNPSTPALRSTTRRHSWRYFDKMNSWLISRLSWVINAI